MPRNSTFKNAPWEYPLGSRVVVHGLQQNPELNGRTGTVKSLLKNCLKSFHTTRETVLRRNGRQIVELDAVNLTGGSVDCEGDGGQTPETTTKKTVLLRPSNLFYEARSMDDLSREELLLILSQRKGTTSSGSKKKLQDAVMKNVIRPVVVQYNLNETETAIEIGGIASEARAADQSNQEFAKYSVGQSYSLFNMTTVEMPEDRKDDPPLQWLGGSASPGDMTNTIPKKSIYRSLKRDGKPPLPGISEEKAMILLKGNKKGQEFYRKCRDGPLTISFSEDMDQEKFSFVVWNDFEKNTTVASFHYFQSYSIDLGGYRPRLINMWNRVGTGIVSSILVHELLLHLQHRFFRVLASHLSPKFRHDLYDGLRQDYQTEKKWKIALDLTIAMADAMLIRRGRDTATGLLHVGEALEATGQHGQAALVYQDLGKLLKEGKLTDENQVISKHMPHFFAGIAFHRAQDYDAALEEYDAALEEHLKALKMDLEQTGREQWHVNRDVTNDLFVEVHMNYRSMVLCTNVKGEMNEYIQKVRMASLILLELLNDAGFVYKDRKTDKSFERQKKDVQVLPPRHKSSPEDALAMVIERSESASQFHHMMVSLLPKEDVGRLIVGRSGAEKNTMSSKRQARNDIITSYYPSAEPISSMACDNPDCTKPRNGQIKLMSCPCGGALYCGSECQHKCWADHKKAHKALMAAKSQKKK